jgi:LmbE family N-acetylglucosaminyl deacetylase
MMTRSAESAPMITVATNLAVVSPHLDDAVFSTWWHMVRAERVVIITVFAGVPKSVAAPTPPTAGSNVSAQRDTRWRSFFRRARRASGLLTTEGPLALVERLRLYRQHPAATALARRDEDRRIAARHGWQAFHLEFLDEPYRSAAVDSEALSSALFDAVPSTCDLLLVPGAIGGHPDHLAARDATLKVLRTRYLPTRLYADLPYATRYGWPSWAVESDSPRHSSIDEYYEKSFNSISGWRVDSPAVHRLTAGDQQTKLKAMRAYKTQYRALEGGASRWLSHPHRIAAEVTWSLERVG